MGIYRTLPIRSGGGGSSESIIYPWDPVVFSTNNNMKVKFYPGSINGLVPANMTTIFDISNSQNYYVILNCNAGNGQITSSTLLVQTNGSNPIGYGEGSPPNSFQVTIGMILQGAGFNIFKKIVTAQPSQPVTSVFGSTPSLHYYYTWVIS